MQCFNAPRVGCRPRSGTSGFLWVGQLGDVASVVDEKNDEDDGLMVVWLGCMPGFRGRELGMSRDKDDEASCGLRSA